MLAWWRRDLECGENRRFGLIWMKQNKIKPKRRFSPHSKSSSPYQNRVGDLAANGIA
jgi:hypothetical protein